MSELDYGYGRGVTTMPMRKDAAEILALYRDRAARYYTLHQKMQTIADIYNGRAAIPLPDMDRTDYPSSPNLLSQGVDQMAGRISSVIPVPAFASSKPGTRKFDRRALDAARVVAGWWEEDRLPMKLKQRSRRLIAYGMAPVIMRWDFNEHRPRWEVKHPLDCLPSDDIEPGKVSPDDCIFTYRRTYGWLVKHGYGPHIQALVNSHETPNRDDIFTLVEYIDCECTCLIATGYYPSTHYYGSGIEGGMRGVVLECYENLSEDIPVIVPTRLTLDQMTGQFDNMIGMWYQQAELQALEIIAVKKGIFPDTYLVGRQGEQPKFVDGPHDGRTGRINIVQGGDIKEIQSSPGYLTNPTMDRIERAQRVTAGIPAEFGGESGTNIRTGRRGDAVLSAVIDYPVAEAQEAFSYALQEENEVAMQMAKKVDGSTERTLFVGTGNTRRPVTYKASETFEQEEHVVSYPMAGTDINGLMIALGQRVGMGTMSKETAATLDPYIENPEAEHDRIISEGIEQALMSGLQQQAAAGTIPPLTLSKIMTLVKQDRMELAEALNKVTEDAMAAQQEAQQAQQPQSVDQMSAPADQQAITGMSAIPGANPTQQGLAGLMAKLRQPAMTIQPNRGVAQGAV